MYDNHSREHSLRCQIGQCDGHIRLAEAHGDTEKAQTITAKRNKLVMELREILSPTKPFQMSAKRNPDGTITLTMTAEQADHLAEVADGNWDIYATMKADDVDDGDMSEEEIEAEVARMEQMGSTLAKVRNTIYEALGEGR